MPKEIWTVSCVSAGPVIDLGEVQYIDEQGVLRGGFSCIGEVPQGPTCLVLIEASTLQFDALAEKTNYLFVEEVTDAA